MKDLDRFQASSWTGHRLLHLTGPGGDHSSRIGYIAAYENDLDTVELWRVHLSWMKAPPPPPDEIDELEPSEQESQFRITKHFRVADHSSESATLQAAIDFANEQYKAQFPK